MPAFDRLLPPAEPASALDVLAATRPWERAPGDRPLVLVNMVATLDGRVAIEGGSSKIGGDGDLEMFHALRCVVDGVLAGTGTLRAESYGRLVRKPERRAARAALGLAEDPVAIIFTRSGDVPFEAPMFEAPGQPIAIVATPGAVEVPAAVSADVTVIELEDPSPGAALRAVRESHGVRAVLCEGGPTLNRSLLAEGVLDEFFLTVGPLIAGGSGDVLRAVGGDELAEPARARLLHVLRHGDELFLRYAL
jgi:riboflavin-specific deaminase-like protein